VTEQQTGSSNANALETETVAIQEAVQNSGETITPTDTQIIDGSSSGTITTDNTQIIQDTTPVQ